VRQEPTGQPTGFRADAVAVAKKNLTPGDVLDGEGGCCAWGRLTTSGQSWSRAFFRSA
jgi:predicted homoserine dehydrogenase-like protein